MVAESRAANGVRAAGGYMEGKWNGHGAGVQGVGLQLLGFKGDSLH